MCLPHPFSVFFFLLFKGCLAAVARCLKCADCKDITFHLDTGETGEEVNQNHPTKSYKVEKLQRVDGLLKKKFFLNSQKHFHLLIFSDSVMNNEIRAHKMLISAVFYHFKLVAHFPYSTDSTKGEGRPGAWPPQPSLRPRERSGRPDEARRRSLPPTDTQCAQPGQTAGRSGGFFNEFGRGRDSLHSGQRSGCRLFAKQDQLTAPLPRDAIAGRRE